MLVLSRKTGQRAVIAGNIRVVVLSVQGDRVKLGFEAPGNVPIHREEVYQRIEQETHVRKSAFRRAIDDRRGRRDSNAGPGERPFPQSAADAVVVTQ